MMFADYWNSSPWPLLEGGLWVVTYIWHLWSSFEVHVLWLDICKWGQLAKWAPLSPHFIDGISVFLTLCPPTLLHRYCADTRSISNLVLMNHFHVNQLNTVAASCNLSLWVFLCTVWTLCTWVWTWCSWRCILHIEARGCMFFLFISSKSLILSPSVKEDIASCTKWCLMSSWPDNRGMKMLLVTLKS